jgi:hypothetical protein
MKRLKTSIVDKTDGPCRSKRTVKVEASAEELAELRAALAVVDKFKSAALHTIGWRDSPEAADWTMVGYAVKSDAVLVTVQSGMCG